MCLDCIGYNPRTVSTISLELANTAFEPTYVDVAEPVYDGFCAV
jgi:hypothetical protein